MSSGKTIYILIGQKGSGKSLAGQIIQDMYGIKFVRVENIARRVKKGRAVDDGSYHTDVFSQIEMHLRIVLENEPSIAFESTGLGSAFDRMLQNLRKDFQVITVGIKADPELCFERIKNRDKSTHIDVSDKDVRYINSLVRQQNFECDYAINNNGNRDELVSSIRVIFRRGVTPTVV